MVLDVVSGKVLGAGNNVFLSTYGVGRGHAADAVHVFAVGFLCTAPERVAYHVHTRSQVHVVLRGGRLVTDCSPSASLQVQIPRCGAQRGSRKRRRVVLLIVLAVVLTSIEIHATTCVAVAVAAHLTEASDNRVRAAFDVAIVLTTNGNAHHLAGFVC